MNAIKNITIGHTERLYKPVGYTMLANRWDHNAAGVSPLTMPRVNQLTTQLGGVVSVSYGQSHPCPGGGSYIRYPHDCFPAWFTNGSSSGWTL